MAPSVLMVQMDPIMQNVNSIESDKNETFDNENNVGAKNYFFDEEEEY